MRRRVLVVTSVLGGLVLVVALALLAATAVGRLAGTGGLDLESPTQDPAPSDLDVHVAPAPDCDAGNDGRSAATAVCTLADAQQVVTDVRARGGADGDLTVRFAPGRYDIGTFYWTEWAEPDHTLAFVPTWWGEQETGPRPQFVGDGDSNDHWLALTRPSDRPEAPVGEVEVAALEVSGYTNGIMVNGGLALDGGPDQRAQATAPPVPHVRVEQVVLQDMGNREDADGPRNESALGLRNVAEGEVRESTFTDIANTGEEEVYAHGIYAMDARSVTVSGNDFRRVSGDPVRLRNNNQDFVVRDNVFTRSGSSASVSDWYVSKDSAQERDQPWETHSEKPEMKGNEFLEGGYGGQPVKPWKSYDGNQ